MIFLSAQPDEYYFLWQLKLLVYNFTSFGIIPEDIHILISYEPVRGLQEDFKTFMQENKRVNIHAYPDTRESKYYASSIRPHIIAKHFRAFPKLQHEVVFYHDSDIVFKGLPDFDILRKGSAWYGSDTRSYLSSVYIRQTVGEAIFNEMCDTVGIPPAQVVANDLNGGGAQYVLKNVTAEFWEKTEKNCEELFILLSDKQRSGFYHQINEEPSIQAWCADMWVIWWNAILEGREFQIHRELDFAWTNSPVTELEQIKILHYTGPVHKNNPRLFRKTDYVNYSPFYSDLSGIDPTLCGGYLRSVIQEYIEAQRAKRIDLTDVTFLIPVKIDSENRLDNVYVVVQYLSRHFNTNIIVTEVDKGQKIISSKFPSGVGYCFVPDEHPRFHHARYNNMMIRRATTPYISLYDADIILPLNQILESVSVLRENEFTAVSPYSGNFLNVGPLLKAMFVKMQDVRLLEDNEHKLGTGGKRSYGGAIFLNRQAYLTAGLDNENIGCWGPEDIERIKRLTILGYRVKRLKGNIYHLDHPRGINSGYQSSYEFEGLMTEYLKVCNSTKEELQEYVNSWPWATAI